MGECMWMQATCTLKVDRTYGNNVPFASCDNNSHTCLPTDNSLHTMSLAQSSQSHVTRPFLPHPPSALISRALSREMFSRGIKPSFCAGHDGCRS